MSIEKFPQVPLSIAARKTEPRSQFGALCYRTSRGKPQVLLVTSRGTGRWLVPKGWPVPGATPAESAAIEAFEEAGAEGHVHPVCLGLYSYVKAGSGRAGLPCVVALYPLRVEKLRRRFPERAARKRKWTSPRRAAGLVDAPELAAILRRFDPALLER